MRFSKKMCISHLGKDPHFIMKLFSIYTLKKEALDLSDLIICFWFHISNYFTGGKWQHTNSRLFMKKGPVKVEDER